jgi:hypothetical protein
MGFQTQVSRHDLLEIPGVMGQEAEFADMCTHIPAVNLEAVAELDVGTGDELLHRALSLK